MMLLCKWHPLLYSYNEITAPIIYIRLYLKFYILF